MTAMNEQAFIAASFNPLVAPGDAVTALWLAEVTLRLRRELAWCWQLSGAQTDAQSSTGGGSPLPPAVDALSDSIDRLRHHDTRAAFMVDDATARYLGEQIASARSQRQQLGSGLRSGSRWQHLADRAGLDDTAQFVLALALAARTDASFGAVAAACQHESQRPYATLALAQRLCDEPLGVIACLDPAHALYRHGLLSAPTSADGSPWWLPLELPAPLALLLLDPAAPWPASLTPVSVPVPGPASDSMAHDADRAAALAWLRALPPQGLQIVPLVLPFGGEPAPQAAALAAAGGRPLAALAPDLRADHPALPGLAAAAWLLGVDLLAPQDWATHPGALPLEQALAPLAALPLRWWLPVADATAVRAMPARWLAPALFLAALPLAERRDRLAAALPPALATVALEAARRFRLNEQALGQVTATLRTLPEADEHTLHALCRAAATVDIGALALPVAPRFTLAELVLPPRQQGQLAAIVSAMSTLARVHQEWGTAKAWNEGGLAVLFCGPPGTGKTMAAEVLAHELALPMYRVDLSQVVNKYIGETEKNLRRIFDAAEAADCLLFFDEADALFGKRTEVKDAHDRYANIEVSYLLERMERFKGLAVLATNRRKDLDEAFARRLRFIIDFPLPGAAERERLWRSMFPPAVDVSGLDFGFVAQRFEMAGGPIRSAAFNACLHAAAVHGGRRLVAMPELLLAVKRELEKAGRETQREQFGHYASLLGSSE